MLEQVELNRIDGVSVVLMVIIGATKWEWRLIMVMIRMFDLVVGQL